MKKLICWQTNEIQKSYLLFNYALMLLEQEKREHNCKTHLNLEGS